MKELLGKTIKGLSVNDDQTILKFDHPDGTFTYFITEADCCSETWFADITGVSELLGSTVTEVENMELPVVEDGRRRQEVDQFYGVKLKHTKGITDIIYRNSSNGYYGGSVRLQTDLNWFAWFAKTDPFADDTGLRNMTQLKDDWQA